MSKKGIIKVILILVISIGTYFVFQFSTNVTMPKPRGYFRIDLPEKSYTPYQSLCAAWMEVPSYSKVEVITNKNSRDSCWFNIFYPRLQARIHCTYLPIDRNFEKLITEAYNFAVSHEVKATALKRTLVEDSTRNVFGIIYDIEGEAASQIQFFLTDSTTHFFRGSLYFFNPPNPDSVAPVLSFIKEDILHLTQTLRWK